MNNQDFLNRLRAAFRTEAEEHFEAMASGLIALESESADVGVELERVYRAAHSLKGAARAVGLGDIESLCQSLEAVFRAWRSGSTGPSQELFDTLHSTLTLLQQLMGSGDADGQALEEARQRLVLLTESPGMHGASAPSAPMPPRPDAPKPPLPAPLAQVEPTAPPVEATPAPADGGANATVRVAVDRLDDLLRQVEATLAAKLNAEHLQLDLRALRSEFVAYRKAYERSVRNEVLDILGRDTVEGILVRERFDSQDEETRRLERHIRSLGTTAQTHAKTLGRMVDTLMQDTKYVAMQPFSSLTQAFPRMMRELARAEGKEVRFKVLGESVEIDKRILDELKTPMTHLLRNCLDHGVEKPSVRVAAGKDPRAQISVAVSQVGSAKVEVLVADDGSGISTEAIAKAAVGRNHITREQADALTPEQAADLIFLSGLSSAPIVTDLSGHGLGMAIVRQKVEELGGTISVESRAGEGTTFRILLPLTTATFRGVVVEVVDHSFVMPAGAIERVLRIAQSDVVTVESQETLKVDGRIVPLVRLEEVLELPRTSLPGVYQEFLQVVVVRSGIERVGFAVDRVLREQEVLVKGLGPQLVRVRNVAGATVLGSGRVVPILNMSDLVASAQRTSVGRRRRGDEAGKERKPRICVAEDSITSRMLLKNILEAAGYEVITAVDGAEALSLLKTEPVDLLVSDVEMPRLSGLELTEKVRQEARLEAMPIVLVTALESREDRERGIDAGANAYIVKSSFDQGNLLDTIRRFL